VNWVEPASNVTGVTLNVKQSLGVLLVKESPGQSPAATTLALLYAIKAKRDAARWGSRA